MTERKVAIITGSATGVGAATALALARRNYDVLINYSKSEAQAKESLAACRHAGADAMLWRANVAEDNDCRAMVQATIDKWGRIDALVNNAGISSFAGATNWDAIDAQLFQYIVGVNALGTLQMIRACVPHLKSARGAIVNVSSIAGALGIGSSVAYIASKGAVNSMTLYFARALAPEVRVNAVCPGMITTRWFVDGLGQEAYEKIKASYEGNVPLARASTPEDVADAVVWLIEGARSITGELVLMDNGLHLGSTPARIPAKS
jgi:3-oxoacyl-[acyl-carrier protein] reductase